MFKKLCFATFSWWILTPTNPQFDNGWKQKVKAILTKIKGFLSILCLSVYLYVCFFVSSKRQKCWTDRDQLFFGTSRDPLPRTRFDFWKFWKFTKFFFNPRNVCLFWFYNADMQKIRQKLRIYIFCLSGCLSFCLHKKKRWNGWTIFGQIFCMGSQMTPGKVQMLRITKHCDKHLIKNCKSITVFIIVSAKRKYWKIEQQIKVEIEDGR